MTASVDGWFTWQNKMKSDKRSGWRSGSEIKVWNVRGFR